MKSTRELPARTRKVPRRPPRAFTLVETLITVMIVAVLFILAFSVAGQAKVRSLNAKCFWNLRSTGFAALRYFSDHNGRFPPSKYWHSRLSTIATPGMRDYLGFPGTAKSTSAEYLVDSILTCPKLKADYPNRFPLMLNRCYAMNSALVARDPNLSNDPNAPANPGSPQRLVNVSHPSRMLAFTEGAADPGGIGEFGTIVAISMVNAESGNRLLYPHHERQNVVYLDGHAESLTKEEFRTPASPREFWGDPRMPVK